MDTMQTKPIPTWACLFYTGTVEQMRVFGDN